jgi:hypothetical protein
MLDRDMRIMGEHLRYWHICKMDHTQSSRLDGIGVLVTWKPILWYVKGQRRGPWSAFIATTNRLTAPILDRLRRFPHRSLRPEMLAAFVQGWRFMAARDFRLDLTAKLARHAASLTEIRLVAGEMKRPDNPDWEGVEHDIAATRITASIDGCRIRMTGETLCSFSLHALARRFQRGADGSEAAVLFDCLTAAQIDPATLLAGGYRVVTDASGGGWRGRSALQCERDGKTRRILSIRTWLPE